MLKQVLTVQINVQPNLWVPSIDSGGWGYGGVRIGRNLECPG
jgi:hypothetical protein